MFSRLRFFATKSSQNPPRPARLIKRKLSLKISLTLIVSTASSKKKGLLLLGLNESERIGFVFGFIFRIFYQYFQQLFRCLFQQIHTAGLVGVHCCFVGRSSSLIFNRNNILLCGVPVSCVFIKLELTACEIHPQLFPLVGSRPSWKKHKVSCDSNLSANMSEGAGFIFLFVAIFFNGTFIVPYKQILNKVRSVLCFSLVRLSATILFAQIALNPLVFSVYLSVGIFLTSWMLQIFLPLNSLILSEASDKFAFPPMGLLSGMLLMMAIGANMIGVEILGISMTQGIVGGTGLVTSFLWGLKFNGIPQGVAFSVVGVVLVCIGVVGIAFSKSLVMMFSNPPRGEDSLFGIDVEFRTSKISSVSIRTSNHSDASVNPMVKISPPSSHWSSTSAPAVVKLDPQQGVEKDTTRSPWVLLVGVIWAVVAGLCGGTFLVPNNYVTAAEQGIPFMLSFGTGSVLTAPVLLAMSVAHKGMPELHLQWQIVCLSMFAGFLFCFVPMFLVAAIPIIGFALAAPLIQVSIIVAGSWGIFLFKVSANAG